MPSIKCQCISFGRSIFQIHKILIQESSRNHIRLCFRFSLYSAKLYLQASSWPLNFHAYLEAYKSESVGLVLVPWVVDTVRYGLQDLYSWEHLKNPAQVFKARLRATYKYNWLQPDCINNSNVNTIKWMLQPSLQRDHFSQSFNNLRFGSFVTVIERGEKHR